MARQRPNRPLTCRFGVQSKPNREGTNRRRSHTKSILPVALIDYTLPLGGAENERQRVSGEGA